MPVLPSRRFHPRRRFFGRCRRWCLRSRLLMLLLLPAVSGIVPPPAALAGAQRVSVAERGAAGCEEVARGVDDLGRVCARKKATRQPREIIFPRAVYHPARFITPCGDYPVRRLLPHAMITPHSD